MKKFYLLFISVLLYSCSNDSVTPVVTTPPAPAPFDYVVSSSYSNYIIGWGFHTTMAIKNNGNANSNNLSVRIYFTATHGANSYYDSSTIFWPDTLVPTHQEENTFDTPLPTSYIASNVSLKIITQ